MTRSHTENFDKLWMVVPFLPADADSLVSFLDRHRWFCEDGGHILFKSAAENIDIHLRSTIESAGCELVASRDSGLYDAWNQAMDTLASKALTPCGYVTFLGLDDTLCEPYCQTVARLASSGAGPDFCFGDAEHMLHGRIRYQPSPPHPRLFGADNYVFDIAHPGLMNRWGTISKYRFDTRYQLAGDFDFYVGITRRVQVSYLKIPEMQAIIGAEGMSNSIAALEIYPREWSLISSTRKVKLDTPRLKIALFRVIAHFPLAFNSLRRASWFIRNSQSLHRK